MKATLLKLIAVAAVVSTGVFTSVEVSNAGNRSYKKSFSGGRVLIAPTTNTRQNFSGGTRYRKNIYRPNTRVNRGFRRGTPVHHRRFKHSNRYNNHNVYTRSFGSSRRSGVYLNSKIIRKKDRLRNNRRAGVYHKNYRHIKRRSTLASRNQRFRAQQNRRRHVNNNAPVVIQFDDQLNYDGLYGDGGAILAGPQKPIVTPPCPSGLNCGYRLYDNGTGPRIIVLGTSNEGLPDYDGLNGPKVIRVGE